MLFSRFTPLHYQENVYNAVIKWIKHDIASRESCVSSLKAHVSLSSLPTKFLWETVWQETLIRNAPLCKDLVIEELMNYISPEHRSQWSDPTCDIFSRRINGSHHPSRGEIPLAPPSHSHILATYSSNVSRTLHFVFQDAFIPSTYVNERCDSPNPDY